MICEKHGNDLNKCVHNFHYLEFPIENNLMLEVDTHILKEKINCDLTLLKILLIRLRKHKGNLNDWKEFKSILETNIDFILNTDITVQKHTAIPKHKGIRLRWLVSFLDTYIDYGDEIESRNAFIASVFQRNEKIFSTLTNVYSLTKKEKYVFNYIKELSGIHINGESDMIHLFLERLNKILIKTPTILKINQEILKRILEDKNSLYSRVSEICSNSLFQDPINEFLNI